MGEHQARKSTVAAKLGGGDATPTLASIAFTDCFCPRALSLGDTSLWLTV